MRTFGPDRIRLCRVPGYSGILGNETADVLARLGSLSGRDLVVGPDPPNPHGWVIGEEQRRWGKGSGCCVSRCLWPTKGHNYKHLAAIRAWLQTQFTV